MSKKSTEGGYFDKLDSAIYSWFSQERERCCPVTAPLLLEKSSDFHLLVYSKHFESFLASTSFNGFFT